MIGAQGTCALSGRSIIFFGGEGHAYCVFFQVSPRKYLKTAQFINLDSRPMGGGL